VEYRDFQYSNEFGGVDLKRGSLMGTALSWAIIKALHIVYTLAFAGLCFATWKYFTADLTPPAIAASLPSQAVPLPTTPVIDYRLNPPPIGAVASPAAVVGALHSAPAPRAGHGPQPVAHPHGIGPGMPPVPAQYRHM
jgi:hypothetical protein